MDRIATNVENHDSHCFGIDLGTTNSVMAFVNVKPNGDLVSNIVKIPRVVDEFNNINNKIKMKERESETLPSFVYYNVDENYKPIVGDYAKTEYPLRHHLVAKSIKSQMGNAVAEGLDSNIPDKTPSDVSSRILKHMIVKASRKLKCNNINDVVITVPANFDSVMCSATIDAAEKAGITVRNADGSDRNILLSEPNAVIYDLINLINNGGITSNVLDLSKPQKVLVFDLGGGTLDITVHDIARRDDNPNILKINEIATNRYTRLGGDDFDERIAETMYARFCEQYKDKPDFYKKIVKEKDYIMTSLRSYAEELKISLNEDVLNMPLYSDDESGWGDDDDDAYDVGGNIPGVNAAYDDKLKKSEIEEILKPFFAYDLKYDDYERIEGVQNKSGNIIFPILDVLDKVKRKLGDSEFKIDAVILNGGMSRFYMVKERLKEFFGMDPIEIVDPDLAVARGAAIYHYYLHNNKQMVDDMMKYDYKRNVGGSDAVDSSRNTSELQSGKVVMEWGGNILNDSLYLRLRGHEDQEIIPTGAELPFESEELCGFRLNPGANKVEFPIRSKSIDGSFRTISTGFLSFAGEYPNGADVVLRVRMSANKVITIKAWACADNGAQSEEGTVQIEIGDNLKKDKFGSPNADGDSLLIANPKNEVVQIKSHCRTLSNKGVFGGARRNANERLREISLKIRTCANKNDFAAPMVEAITSSRTEKMAKHRLLTIARKIGSNWPAEIKSRIGDECEYELRKIDLSSFGQDIQLATECVYSIGVFGNELQIGVLNQLHGCQKLLNPLIYVNGKRKIDVDWVMEKAKEDCRLAMKGCKNNLQNSAYAVGMGLSNDGKTDVKKREEALAILLDVIENGKDQEAYFVPCLIAVGLIADSRTYDSRLSAGITDRAKSALAKVIDNFSDADLHSNSVIRSAIIADKMLDGIGLYDDEERFLLEKLDVE